MDILSTGISLIILIYSAILHEVAHGYVAYRLGDPTAKLLGRLTLNPIPHIDPLMSIIVPLFLFLSNSPIIFGGAKPVLVDPFNLKDGRKDMALVSLAGPLTNVALAITAALLMHLLAALGGAPAIVGFILLQILWINIMLAIFNLLPIPPLDGSKVFALLLPERYAASYLSIGSFGIMIVFFLLYFSGWFQGFIEGLYRLALSLLGF